MPGPTPSPSNPDLTELVNLLGHDSVRLLVRTFLREYPLQIQELKDGDRAVQHRVAHSLKSNARLVGAHALSARMLAYENLLSRDGARRLTAEEIAEIAIEFARVAEPLRTYANQENAG